MKKILFALFAIVFCSAVSAGAQTLKVGVSADYKPFEYIDDNGAIVGFDIDLLKEITKRTGIEFAPQNMPFDTLIVALKAGKIDMAMSAMSATDERRKHVDFTDSYFESANLFLQRKDDAPIKNSADLVGKRLGLVQGTIQEMAAKKIDGAKLVLTDNIATTVLNLKAGKVDAVIVDSVVGYGYLKQNKDTLVESFVEPDGSEGISIAFDKDKFKDTIEKINTAISDIKSSAVFDELLKKYDLK
ncbi:basic amino acid ABC transporter substrate-binding protein [Campylobacter sp. 19-13652]|uniref:basic amino acid ABC transporter substrate-binding protein n=1 Tax=Campylobacter sp. 19-13652 TaxID=2840180 RepID=UPI001C7814BA|nr:basic amino acid ABC transporter substrate-binding protein [Campylobacter sp. 19-13652]BCX79802.1 putative histidine-binding protein [Campylobacter sp. 19-13652]